MGEQIKPPTTNDFKTATAIPKITMEEAGLCARQTDYAHNAVIMEGQCECGKKVRNEINWGDASAFFLEGYERARRIETRNLRHCIKALERIAEDWDHIKRQDMVRIAGEALTEIGSWRKVQRGEFARHGHLMSKNPPNH